LSIVKALVEAMGGSVGFTSELGQGSIFYFSLGLAEAPALAIPEVAVKRSLKTGAPRILVCEDEPDVATLLAMILEREGFSVDIAHDAAGALKLLNERNYLGMTLDLLLPDMSGVRVIRELRADSRFSDLPIIVISAKAEAGRRELNGDAIGVIDWLTKPIEPERISHLVRHLRGAKPHCRVLHVEDDQDIIGLLEVSLGDSVEVTRALTLAEAKRFIVARSFDLVVLDVGLPDGSGIDLLPLLGAGGKRVPVVLYTANEMPEEIGAQVAETLVKSRTSEEELTATIRRLLGQELGTQNSRKVRA
jgi:DNA-binding response OmpR family regulator